MTDSGYRQIHSRQALAPSRTKTPSCARTRLSWSRARMRAAWARVRDGRAPTTCLLRVNHHSFQPCPSSTTGACALKRPLLRESVALSPWLVSAQSVSLECDSVRIAAVPTEIEDVLSPAYADRHTLPSTVASNRRCFSPA